MSEKETKSESNLGSNIVVGLMGGALGGYLIGSGIEDILQHFSINPPVEYMKTIVSGVSSLGFSILGTLKYFNRDEYEGMLVTHTVKEEHEKPEIESQPNLEGIATAVKELTNGVKNKVIAQNIYNAITGTLRKNPLEKARKTYELNRKGFLVDSFEVFKPFLYEEREINPRETLDKFFKIGGELYKMVIERMSIGAEKLIVGEPDTNGYSKDILFKLLLNQEIGYAQDIASWVTYLSYRGGVVGSKVRSKLSQLGITNPDYLAEDVEVLGKNILSLYDRLEKASNL